MHYGNLSKKQLTMQSNISKTNNFESEVIAPLLYFSLFKHPLTLDEIFKFSKAKSKEALQTGLDKLVLDGKVYKKDDFFSIEEKITEQVNLRKLGENRRTNYFAKVKRRANLISKFPFVRAVFISGTFSKGIFFKDDDVDFFIVTQTQRLWLCRTLLILFKKIFLLNSRKFFCVNYFVDENNLEIPDKNNFTATEIATLLPMKGAQVCEDFFEKNKWVNDFYPNFISPEIQEENLSKNKIIEILLNNQLGNVLENRFKNLTMNTWKKKFSTMGKEELDIKLRSKDGVSKHHPKGYQDKVLDRYNELLKSYANEIIVSEK